MSPSLHDEITREYYQTTASRSHVPSRAAYENAARQLMRRLKPWLPHDRNARCIDLACGCGELLFLLESAGFRHTTGVDLCAEELQHAREFVHGEVVQSDVLNFLRDAPGASAEFITALNFLEHLQQDSLLATLIEIRRVLAPGGALVAMVPNAVSPFGNLTRHWDMTHHWAFTPNNFRQLASLAGFAPEIDLRECGPVPHGAISGLRYLLWQVLRAGIAAWLMVEVADRKDGIYTMDMLVRLHASGQQAFVPVS